MLATQPAPIPLVRPVPLTPAERQLLALVGQLIARVDDLQAKVDDLEAWTQELGDDLLDRTGAPALEVA